MWICRNCGDHNRNHLINCGSCAAPKDETALPDDVGSELSDEPPRSQSKKRQPTRVPVPCPDCLTDISSKAGSCPHCGRFIQNFQGHPVIVLPGKGWSLAVTGGILLSYLVAALAGAFLMFVVFGALSDLGKSRP